jgi:hypothetical protein
MVTRVAAPEALELKVDFTVVAERLREVNALICHDPGGETLHN